MPSAFIKAVKKGKLPNLRRIELKECTLNDREWPEVPEFSLETGPKSDASLLQKIISQLTELTLDCRYDNSHIISKKLEKLASVKLAKATDHDLLQLNDILREDKLPNLSALVVHTSPFKESMEFDRFACEFDPKHLQKLENLLLQGFIVSSEGMKTLCQKLPYWQLRKLNMSESQGMTGNLSALLTQSFPRLNTLILRSCHLSSEDIETLVQTNVKGKLPELKHLDI